MRINNFELVQCATGDLVRCGLVLCQVNVASVRSFGIQLDRFKFVQSLESLDQGVRGLIVTLEFALGHVVFHVVLEGKWVVSEQVDNHEEIAFEIALVAVKLRHR